VLISASPITERAGSPVSSGCYGEGASPQMMLANGSASAAATAATKMILAFTTPPLSVPPALYPAGAAETTPRVGEALGVIAAQYSFPSGRTTRSVPPRVQLSHRASPRRRERKRTPRSTSQFFGVIRVGVSTGFCLQIPLFPRCEQSLAPTRLLVGRVVAVSETTPRGAFHVGAGDTALPFCAVRTGLPFSRISCSRRCSYGFRPPLRDTARLGF
jgi:hypothetical protein